MKDLTRGEPRIAAAAEKQMQAWAFAQEIAERSLRIDQEHPATAKLGDYIAISREAGANAEEVAEIVGDRLGWEVLDKGLVERIAQRYRLDADMLALVDETESNWAHDILGAWLDSRVVPHEKYVVLLGRLVTAAARRGNVVFVGRGAQFFLPAEQGLSVRIVAPQRYRVDHIMRLSGLDAAKARQLADAIDRGRAEFVQKFFHRDVADPHFYHMVLNVERLGTESTAEQIIAACRRRMME